MVDNARAGTGLAMIRIDASGAAAGVNFDTYIASFLATAPESGTPVFDHSSNFFGTEVVFAYGSSASSQYVRARGDSITYNFSSHTVYGTINTIEFGTLGQASYDSAGSLINSDVALTITGLNFANALSPEAEVEATGAVHNLFVALMDASGASADRVARVNSQLDAYAQHFTGSAYDDIYVGTQFDDIIEGRGGADTVDGGGGEDEVVFTGLRSDYTIVTNGTSSSSVTTIATGQMTRLSNAETARFDGTLVDLVDGTETLTGLSPGDIGLTATTVLESARIGAEVATLSAVDDDSSVFSFALTEDKSGSFAISGNRLVTTRALDYETAASHTITVTVSDEKGNRFSKDLTIGVGNVDEAPVIADSPRKTIAETAAVNTTVVDLKATDPEGGAVTFGLPFNPGGYFRIVDGKVQIAKALDYETASSHVVTIAARDAAGNTSTKDVTIKVSNIDEAPIGLTVSGKLSLTENLAKNTVIGTVSATDPEDPTGHGLSYRLVDTAGNLFRLSGKTLVTTKAIDYEAYKVKSDTVTLKVTDAGGLSSTKTIAITFVDANEAPSVPTLKGSTVSENSKKGSLVGTVASSDPEGRTLKYALTDTAGGLFALSGTRLVTTGKAINYETLQKETVTVQVSDGVHTQKKTFTVTVRDAMETINGTSKSEVLKGGIGADKIVGGAGNDTLYGAAGLDDLYGGAGRDTFMFKSIADMGRSKTATDTIFDFSQGQKDRIDLSDIDATAKTAKNDAFSLIGTKAFSKTAGELRYEKGKADTYVYGDTNGDGKADFVLHIDSPVALKSVDFFL